MISFHGCDIPQDLLTERRVTGTYEQLEMDAAEKTFEKGDKVVVAGAGTGWLLACIAELAGPENVMGIEPIQSMAQLIPNNVAVDGVPLQCEWGALTADGQARALNVNKSNWAESTIQRRLGVYTPGIKFQDLLDQGYDCLALDVEGGEHEILTGTPLDKLRKLMIEVHTQVLTPDQCVDILTVLQKAGLVSRSSLIRDRDGAVIQVWSR